MTVKISTKYNKINDDYLKKQKKHIFYAILICGLIGVPFIILLSIFNNISYLFLLIPSVIIIFSYVFYSKFFNKFSNSQKNKPYNIIVFSETDITVTLIDESLISSSLPVTYSLKTASLRKSSENEYFLKLISENNEEKTYIFNNESFIEGNFENLFLLFNSIK